MEKLENDLQDSIAGETEVGKRITHAVEVLKTDLQVYLQQEMTDLRGRLSEVEQSVRTRQTQLQTEMDQLKELMGNVQQSLSTIQEDDFFQYKLL